jgi:L-threonylcarbamoyladenylate synthase
VTADPDIDRVAEVLAAGGVAVLPTDTLYGLCALATDATATNRIFDIKGRTATVPIAVLCADADQALSLTTPEAARGVQRAAADWWPGPLTLVVPRRDGLDLHLGEPEHTIGLRVPANDLLRAVAARVGPIAATSANRHGAPPITQAAQVPDALGDGVDLVIDGGELAAGASTVIDATSWPWTQLRAGPVPFMSLIADAEPPGER